MKFLLDKIRIILLVLGDICALYAALLATLLFRYGAGFYAPFLHQHLVPFSIVFALWIVVFYIAGLYDLRRLRNNLDFLKALALTLFTNAAIAIFFFYLIPIFGITPKTNLFLFIAIFAAIMVGWRRFFNRLTATSVPLLRVALVGEGKTAEELFEFVKHNPQFGYEVAAWFRKADLPRGLRTLEGWEYFIRENRIDFIVIPPQFKKESRLARLCYELLARGVAVRDIPYFYENIFRKVPLAEVNEAWFLEHITNHHRFYDDLKRAGELFFSLVFSMALLPLVALIALVIKCTSRGPVIYAQTRIGRRERPFTLYKFRSMRLDAEKNGPQWKTQGAADPRLTRFGKFLVRSHLDELPQLWNIIRGELSFVGPRPERPEFVSVLTEKIPYYKIRHVIQPGITGWAQINFRYGGSAEDSFQKLEYDIYYLKNRSLVLDLAIILKTLKSFFVNQE